MNDREVKTALQEVVDLCEELEISISHEDGHGAFVIVPYDERYSKWLLDATNDTNGPTRMK